MKEVTALGLFSGGLDSILACRVIAAQSIRVIALKFVTPFFNHDLLRREQEHKAEVKAKYNIDVELVDLSKGYLELLRNPAHGFGKNFNPCIDCKILLFTRARELMKKFNASFLLTGEVLGQRPMSQRRDTLNLIERESGCRDILLRPLCAQHMTATKPEREGLVDREKLYGFSGRGRKQQIQLARQFGITDYPNPAGGCVLTDPNLGTRIERFYGGYFPAFQKDFEVNDINLLLVGRQFCLPDGSWFILGRSEAENETIKTFQAPGDYLLKMIDRPGPTGLIRRAGTTIDGFDKDKESLQQAAGLVVRYGKKNDGCIQPANVLIDTGSEQLEIHVAALADTVFSDWLV